MLLVRTSERMVVEEAVKFSRALTTSNRSAGAYTRIGGDGVEGCEDMVRSVVSYSNAGRLSKNTTHPHRDFADVSAAQFCVDRPLSTLTL